MSGIVFTEQGQQHAGNGSIVCLHGIGGDASSFAPQLAALSQHYHVLSWNMPGYGGSVAHTELSFASLADSVCDWLDSRGIDRAHLLGQSIGGMIAQQVALQYPQRVLSLILVATTTAFGGRDNSFRQAFLQARLKPLDQGQTLADMAADLINGVVGPRITESDRLLAIQSMAAVPESAYRQVLECLVTFDCREAFASIRCPVCLMAGSDDSNVPVRTMQKMALQLPQAVIHEFEQVGHLVNLEAPDEFNERLLCFLSTLK